MNIIYGSKYLNRLKFTFNKLKRKLASSAVIDVFDSDAINISKNISKIYAINLDRQVTRWKNLKKEASNQKVKNRKTLLDFITRISAIDGSKIETDKFASSEVNKLYSLKEHFFIDPDPRLSHLVRSKEIKIGMTSAEIAVALSHIKVWKEIVTNNIPFSLIMEDDVFFEKSFADIVNKAWSELPVETTGDKSFDILYLSFKEVDNKAEKETYSENLFRPIRGFWWLSGYVLSFRGAKKLIDSLPICGPVDMWMNIQFQNLQAFSTNSSIIEQRTDLDSDNSYSIMPILSRVGIHLDKNERDASLVKARKPIFAIGLNKTGTTSLHFALSLLGYKCCHWISDKFSEETSKFIDNCETLPFDAYTDVESIIRRFKELDSQYPDAAFILTTRNIDDWIASRSRHVIRNRAENLKGATHSWTEIDVESWVKEREDHHKSIEDYFQGRKKKLLIIDICGGEQWKPLCEFLELPIPNVAFPNVDPLIKLQTLSRSLMNRVPISSRDCVAKEHDKHPWVRRPESIENYVGTSDEIGGFGTRTGSFSPQLTDSFNSISPMHWDFLNNSFPYNLVKFTQDNIKLNKNNGIQIQVRNETIDDRELSSGALKSQLEYQFGRFEIEMKPVKGHGLISAFFLYRIDPWQEIDIEFLGNNTSQMLVNVYFNPGEDGTILNHGSSGTPVIVNLGFDASTNVHHYAIEWDPNEIRWFVDNDLVHVRRTGFPTPIPNLPMKVFLNLWAPGNSHLAGKLEKDELPKTTEIKSVVLSNWLEPEIASFREELLV